MKRFYEIKIVLTEDDTAEDAGFDDQWVHTFAEESIEDPYGSLTVISADLTELDEHPMVAQLEALMEERAIEEAARIAIRHLFKEATR